MARRKKGFDIHGWINLYKPKGVNSTKAVSILKRVLKPKKVGHGGTLDPLAEGILPIALGEATKLIPYCQDQLKSYEFTVEWGRSTTTEDAEGETVETSDVEPALEDIQSALTSFTGQIEQIPPRYSAIKIDGERAYDLARKDVDFEIKPRSVFIQELRCIEAGENNATFYCLCGKGTYIRSLGRDLAEELGTKGHISFLKRSSVGPMHEKQAFSLAKFEEMVNSAASDDGMSKELEALLDEVLLPPETMLDDIPALAVNDREAVRLRNGQSLLFVSRPDLKRLDDAGIRYQEGQTAITLSQNGTAIAIVDINGLEIKPKRVLNISVG